MNHDRPSVCEPDPFLRSTRSAQRRPAASPFAAIALATLLGAAPGQSPDPDAVAIESASPGVVIGPSGDPALPGVVIGPAGGDLPSVLVMPLGDGRSRLRARLVPPAPGGDTSFLERWLEGELRRRFPKAQQLEIVEMTRAALGSAPAGPQRERHLELVAPDDLVAPVRELLERVLAPRPEVVEIELHAFGVGIADQTAAGTAAKVEVLDRAGYQGRLESLRRDGATLLTNPKLLLHSGMRGSIFVGDQVSYIQDFEVEVGQHAVVADPVIGVVQEGLEVEAGVFIHPQDERITVDIEGTMSTLVRPVRKFEYEIPVPGSQKVTIDLPEVHATNFATGQVVLEKDETGLVIHGLRCFRRDEDGETSDELTLVDLYVRLRRVPLPVGELVNARVILVDPAARRAVARFDGMTGGVLPARVRVFRGAELRGEAPIVERQGNLLILGMEETAFREGDSVR